MARDAIGCCCIGEGGRGCCCVGDHAEGCCCVPPGSRGCCCCGIRIEQAQQQQPQSKGRAFVFELPRTSRERERLSRVPPAACSLGIEQEQWTAWLKLLDNLLQEHDTFYDRPRSELCYWCCPCGPLQAAWCIANPRTHTMHSQMLRMGDAAERTINGQLSASNVGGDVHFRVIGRFGVFLPTGRAQRPLAHVRTALLEHQTRLPTTPPDELAALGVTVEMWQTWMGHVTKEQHAHLFHRCPTCAPALLCCPLGPLQWCLCLACNPLTWWNVAAVIAARAAVEDAINVDLVPCGAHATYDAQSKLQFFRGLPKRTLSLRREGHASRFGRLIEIASVASGVDVQGGVALTPAQATGPLQYAPHSPHSPQLTHPAAPDTLGRVKV